MDRGLKTGHVFPVDARFGHDTEENASEVWSRVADQSAMATINRVLRVFTNKKVAGIIGSIQEGRSEKGTL